MFSIVVPVNNTEIYQQNLLSSLETQIFKDFKLIVIDSINQTYPNAASALNSVSDQIEGEYVIFCHQDINFENIDFLYKLSKMCEVYHFDVAGLVGKIKINGRYEIVTQIVHTPKKIPAGTYCDFDRPLLTETLDECFLIIRTEIYKKYKFKEFSNTWHLYATEYCLRMKNVGVSVYILPIKLWHNSKYGSLDKEYFENICVLCKIYRKYSFITTIYGIWPTNPVLCHLKCFYRRCKLQKLFGRH